MNALAHRAMPALVVLGVLAGLGVTGCAPEPTARSTAPASSVATSGPTLSAPPAGATASATPAASFTLPAGCDAMYSAGMLATLQQQLPPLNDPGVQLLSSQNSRALELLDSGAPTLRCSWGAPGQAGLATNVTVLDAAGAESLHDALVQEGFGCEAAFGGTQCRIEKQTVDLDDNLVTTGEVHYLRDGGWVSTAYVDTIPDGYTEDIARTLWG